MNNIDAGMLIWSDRNLQEPFVMPLIRSDGEETEMIVQKILRLLPGKRIVAVAEVDGKQYLV